jgi:Zn-dependent peptidase ImmA (M78 family)
MAPFAPSRLTLARRRRGLTKSQLAEALELTLRTVVHYEGGTVTPPDERIEDFSRALRFPVAFFSQPEVELLNEAGVSFRSMARMKASQRSCALAAAELALDLTRWIRAQFTLPAPAVPDLNTLRDPEAAALALRSLWNLGDKPIANMVRLLEAKGVRVFSLAEEHDALDGYSFWRDGTPFVFLNTMKSAERSRFDAAHELGHLVLHQHGHPKSRDVEHEAHAFASAFLMPRSSVTAYAPRLATLDRLIEAKRAWGVSLGALAHRMHAVGLISDWQYRALFIEISKRKLRKIEPNPAPREMSLVFEKIFAELRAEGLTKSLVAKQLGWPLPELNALVFGLVLSTTGARTTAAFDEDDSGGDDMPGPLRLALL